MARVCAYLLNSSVEVWKIRHPISYSMDRIFPESGLSSRNSVYWSVQAEQARHWMKNVKQDELMLPEGSIYEIRPMYESHEPWEDGRGHSEPMLAQWGGQTVALKVFEPGANQATEVLPSGRRVSAVLKEALLMRVLARLRLAPNVMGIVPLAERKWGLVMDRVDGFYVRVGTDSWLSNYKKVFAQEPMNLKKIEDQMRLAFEMLSQLEIFAVDFQFFITPDSRVQVIDTGRYSSGKNPFFRPDSMFRTSPYFEISPRRYNEKVFGQVMAQLDRLSR